MHCFYIAGKRYLIRKEPSMPIEKYGQHSFEFRCESRFQDRCRGADPVSTFYFIICLLLSHGITFISHYIRLKSQRFIWGMHYFSLHNTFLFHFFRKGQGTQADWSFTRTLITSGAINSICLSKRHLWQLKIPYIKLLLHALVVRYPNNNNNYHNS